MDTRVIRSTLLPGGDLVTAALDREVMGVADRGGASNLVGDRWADLVAAAAVEWSGAERPVPGGAPLSVDEVHRLDAEPGVAAAASRRGLQNPDLLFVGRAAGQPTIQAADAKFSVETARSRQVSIEVVQALLDLRRELPGFLPEVRGDPQPVPGVFICPDYPLTHLMLRRRQGIVRTTVRSDEVVLVPVSSAAFFGPIEGHRVMAPLAEVDDLPIDTGESLLAGLYYFRLARAAIGFWLDATKPLLLYEDLPVVDEVAVAEEAARRGAAADSAIELIRQWNADVQTVRNARASVEQVAGLPLGSRELRPLIAKIADETGTEVPPSVNKVRRRLGAWYRRELRERVGPLYPPVESLADALQAVAAASREVAPRVEVEAERVVRDLMAEAREGADVDAGGSTEPTA